MLPIIISTLEDTQEREFMARLYEEYERLFFSTALKYAPTHHDAERNRPGQSCKSNQKSNNAQTTGALHIDCLYCFYC